MKYQIIEYDDYRKFVVVQVADTEEGIATAQKLPISLNGLTTVSDFEKQVYTTWQLSIPRETPRTFDDTLLNHITVNTSTTATVAFSIEIIPEDVMQDVAPEPGAVESGNPTDVEVL
jgi:hypothetical protein